MFERNKNTLHSLNFNLQTKTFFIINTLFSLVINTLQSEYLNLNNKLYEFQNSHTSHNDPQFKELMCILKAYEVYLKNSEFCKYLLKFSTINIYLLYILNNSKYTYEYLKSKKLADATILEDFSNYIDIVE